MPKRAHPRAELRRDHLATRHRSRMHELGTTLLGMGLVACSAGGGTSGSQAAVAGSLAAESGGFAGAAQGGTSGRQATNAHGASAGAGHGGANAPGLGTSAPAGTAASLPPTAAGASGAAPSAASASGASAASGGGRPAPAGSSGALAPAAAGASGVMATGGSAASEQANNAAVFTLTASNTEILDDGLAAFPADALPPTNRSPGFSWSGVPPTTQSLALVFRDVASNPAPVKWVLWNIPPSVTQVPAGVGGDAAQPTDVAGASQLGSRGNQGYAGPCCEDHEYEWIIHALDVAELPGTERLTTAEIYDSVLPTHAIAKSAPVMMRIKP
ncbi:MAG: YbhB/YbcL family Raf kinase inhibitor-like protein [Polyangiales bacterium]